MADREGSLWRISTPQEVAQHLISIYRGAAWVEALLRHHAYRAARGSSNAEFYRQVLALLQADNLINLEPTPLVVAEMYAQHIDNPALEAAERMKEATMDNNASQYRFWIDVQRQLERLIT